MTIRDTSRWVDSLRSDVPTLSAGQLAQMLEDAPNDLTVVDIRELQECILRGAVPGARHAPRGMLEFWADPNSEYYRSYFREDAHLVVYCAGGARSVLAARSLMEMGYPKVAHLDGGFGAWEHAGFDIEDVAATSKWIRRPEG